MKCLGQQFCTVRKTFVPVASLKALYSWRILDRTRLGPRQSCSLLHIHLLANDESMGSAVYLFLRRVNECFWYPFMIFILAFLSLWPKVLPLIFRHPKLKLMHLVPGNHEALWKRMQISQHKCIFLLPAMEQFPSNMQLKMKRWKLDAFLYFENFIAFSLRTGALQGHMGAKAAGPRVLLVHSWAAQRHIFLKVYISIMEHI